MRAKCLYYFVKGWKCVNMCTQFNNKTYVRLLLYLSHEICLMEVQVLQDFLQTL